MYIHTHRQIYVYKWCACIYVHIWIYFRYNIAHHISPHLFCVLTLYHSYQYVIRLLSCVKVLHLYTIIRKKNGSQYMNDGQFRKKKKKKKYVIWFLSRLVEGIYDVCLHYYCRNIDAIVVSLFVTNVSCACNFAWACAQYQCFLCCMHVFNFFFSRIMF